MRILRLIIILLTALSLTGCMSVVMQRQKDVAAQSNSDLNAAAKFIAGEGADNVPPSTMWAALAIIEHARNMSAAMGIEPTDLPVARVPEMQWQVNPNSAKMDSEANTKKDATDIQQYSLYALSAAAIAMLLGRLGPMMFKSSPVGQALGMLGHMFGGEDPSKNKVFNKMVSILEAYKQVDPEWRNNKLFVSLSDSMTTAEKDYIKNKINV